MYDGIKNRRDACSAVGTVGARTTHAIPTMLALRRGARRVAPVLSRRETYRPTYWPEGRRRGRAGGRQEYRQQTNLAQPCVRPKRKGAPSNTLPTSFGCTPEPAKFVPSP